jgi:hypothetical protein
MRGLFTPTVGEANVARAGGVGPVTADQGTQSVFGLGTGIDEATQAIQRQTQERQAALGGGGGVQVGQRGLVGLGTSGARND